MDHDCPPARPAALASGGEASADFHLRDITEIDRDFVARHAISALLWDVDGTLMPHHHRLIAPEMEAILASLQGYLPQAILSNCGETRFLELGQIFTGLPVLKGYRVDGRLVIPRLERGRDLWKMDRSTIPRPAGSMETLRKPSGELLELVLDELELEGDQRQLALMVGDQHLTDVAGANLARIRSAKVATIAPTSFPLPIRCFQLFERGLYRIMRGLSSRRSS